METKKIGDEGLTVDASVIGSNSPAADHRAPSPHDPFSGDSESPSHSGSLSHANPPDMGAVYILLGCLTVSGIVVIGILMYCTAHCWRKRCFKPRRSVPAIKISSTNEDGYVALKQTSATNRQSKTVGDQCSSGSSLNSINKKLRTDNDRCKSTTGLICGYQSADNEYNQSNHMEQYEQLLENGVTCTTKDNESKHGESNGQGLLNCKRDSLADELERRSVLHYDIGYEKNHNSCLRGTLTFALRYDYIHRVLMVHVIRANHLLSKDRTVSSMDPYLKLYLLPERYHCKTRLHRRTLDPEFNEMFSFDTPYNSLSSSMLQFTLYDFDRFKRHGLIGNVIMRDLFEKSDLYTWTEYTMHIIASNEKDDYGDLLLYLSYDPEDAKLAITVAKAYNLRPMDITGASDPYVKMIQLHGGKRVKSRRTTTKRANLHPVYNETITFDLPVSQINNTSILIKVMDWDRIGSDDLLGSCVLGGDSPTAEGRQHWHQCFARTKQKSVGMWHSLLAEVPEGFINISK